MARHPAQPENIYELHDSETTHRLYTRWAASYDTDLVGTMDWQGHHAVASKLNDRLTDKASKILDAGCGTGLCGEALQAFGFHNLTGIDLTEAMLDVARDKAIYAALDIADLTEPLSLEPTFDAVCSAGLFSHGPVLPKHLVHMLSPLRPGGLAVHTINGLAYDTLSYRTMFEALQTEGWLAMLEDEPIAYNVGADVRGRLVVFEKTERS